jgi:hypothetical protein
MGSSAARGEESRRTVPIHRATGPIQIDGDLSDPGWQGAAAIDRFWETSPGDDTEPKVKTVAWVTYDDKYFYIAVHCEDPEPGKIRAPYVDRDNILGTDDNVAVFLDTRDDQRSAIEFRINPRGIQGDASYNDANGNEDFSPDYFYDTAARITGNGWDGEYRIPFSSLRYPRTDPSRWGILVWRNYPREFRYAYHSSPIPRGSNCWLCHEMELTGLTGLPAGGHLVAAPYVTAKESGSARKGPGSDFVNKPVRGDAGLDAKWTPNANTALDATINPDFSQIESDVGQIDVNNRFALFYPEKRPFFLEGVDLFDTPIQAVYTRTITSPRWGARATGKMGGATYTALVSEDRGGGLVIIPGSSSNDFALQEYGSIAAIGRVREDFGQSFAGLLVTDRENKSADGGGHNRVYGPDFQWRPQDKDQLTGQVLFSDTQTPNRPDLYPTWDGRIFSSQAIFLSWLHTGRNWVWRSTYQDIGDGFRADDGFVPQVGFRQARQFLGYVFYPEGFLRRIEPLILANSIVNRDGGVVTRTTLAGVQFQGSRNLNGEIDVIGREKTRVGDRALDASYLSYFLQYDVSRRFSRIGLSGFLGQGIDFVNQRVGHGGEVTLDATLKPTDHLELDVHTDRQWLNVDAGARSGRLFTAQIERLKATYNFTARSFVRLIGQYLRVNRDPSLYAVEVPRVSGSFVGSALFGYKINWQTVLFVGYGDNRVLSEQRDLLRASRQFFLKISYAFQS